MSQTIQFHQILEMIDNLSCDEQDDLISIIRHRQIEKRREEIAMLRIPIILYYALINLKGNYQEPGLVRLNMIVVLSFALSKIKKPCKKKSI